VNGAGKGSVDKDKECKRGQSPAASRKHDIEEYCGRK